MNRVWGRIAFPLNNHIVSCKREYAPKKKNRDRHRKIMMGSQERQSDDEGTIISSLLRYLLTGVDILMSWMLDRQKPEVSCCVKPTKR
jgi:hypothetical protein